MQVDDLETRKIEKNYYSSNTKCIDSYLRVGINISSLQTIEGG